MFRAKLAFGLLAMAIVAAVAQPSQVADASEKTLSDQLAEAAADELVNSDEAAQDTLPPAEPAEPQSPPAPEPTLEPEPKPEPQPEPRTFSLAFTGDFLLHNRVNNTAAQHAVEDPTREYDYRPLLRPIQPYIEGVDWAVCHMEVNLSSDGTRIHPYPVFRSPGEIAFDAADLGYDSCTTASNHTLDHGVDGVAESLEVMHDANLHTTGSARSEVEKNTQKWVEINGVRVAHLSYTYGFNGFTVPSDSPWASNLLDKETILNEARAARVQGAEFIILSVHWGNEYDQTPNSQQSSLGPELLASADIDLVVSHHAHVMQPIEYIDGEWLVYGLGNLLANYKQTVRRDELLVQATVTEQSDGTFSAELAPVPLHVEWDTLTVYPSDPQNRPDGLSEALTAELDASWDRVQTILANGSGFGNFSDPVARQ